MNNIYRKTGNIYLFSPFSFLRTTNFVSPFDFAHIRLSNPNPTIPATQFLFLNRYSPTVIFLLPINLRIVKQFPPSFSLNYKYILLSCLISLSVLAPWWPIFMLKKAHFYTIFSHFFERFYSKFEYFRIFSNVFERFQTFLNVFFFPIFPNHPILTSQSLFLAHEQGFALKSTQISP